MCKIAVGINRPGQIQKQIDHLSTKVMNESLNRLVDYRILLRHRYDEVPPRVEYSLTELGHQALDLLERSQKLKQSYLSQTK